jgi:hypothetical protein
LLMALLACGITIFRLWREVGPLRAELTARRAEMGELFITDPNKAHAIGVDWNQDGVCRWRLYLPDGPDWAIRTYIGNQPAFAGDDLQKWLAGPRSGKGRQFSSIGGIPRGREFTLEIRLAKDDDGWYLQEDKGAKARLPQSFNAWLDESERRYPISKVLSSEQTVYPPGEPIILLCIQQANESRSGAVSGDTIVLWMEEYR